MVGLNAPRRELFSASRMAKIRHDGEERRPYKDFTESRAEEAVVASRRARQLASRRHGGHKAAHRPRQGRNRAHPRAPYDQEVAKKVPRARGAGAARRHLHRGRAADRAALVGADALHDASDGDVRAAQNSARPPRQTARNSARAARRLSFSPPPPPAPPHHTGAGSSASSCSSSRRSCSSARRRS